MVEYIVDVVQPAAFRTKILLTHLGKPPVETVFSES